MRVLGLAMVVAGLWVALAAPEPERLGWAAVDAETPPEDASGLDALSPTEWAASAAAPTEWTGLWGLVAYTAWDDSERARRRLAAVVRGLARERHHDRAWAAIWVSLAGGRAAVPGVAEPDDAHVEIRLLAEAIRAALGEREYQAELAIYERVDDIWLQFLLDSGHLPRPRDLAHAEPDTPDALTARLEAHWSAMEHVGGAGWCEACGREIARLRAARGVAGVR